MTNDSAFVFYESFLKTIQNVERFAGKEAAYDYLMSIMEYGCYGLLPDESNPAWLYGFEQVRTAISHAQERRDKQIANGKKGGRPRTSVNAETILNMKNQGMTYKEIAGMLNISESTVKRRISEAQKSQQGFEPNLLNDSQKEVKRSKGFKSGQNLNVNVNVNVNENELLRSEGVLNLDGSKHQCSDPSSSSKHKKSDPLEEFKTTENSEPLEGQNSTVVNELKTQVKTINDILNQEEVSPLEAERLLIESELPLYQEDNIIYSEEEDRVWVIV